MKRASLLLLVIGLLAAGLSVSPVSANKAGGAEKNITFSKDVAPIFFAKCAECHRPGEVAPFSVMSYKDVRPWARSIREKIVNKTMPPWHADPHFGNFKNDRRLSQQEIDTVSSWVDQGAKEGNAKDMPAAPEFFNGWSIGKPDQTFSIPEQTILENGVEKYRYVTVETSFNEDRWIQAAEIRSTGRAAVHHVIVFIQDPKAKGQQDGTLLAGFAPGEQPAVFPAGFGKRIPAGSKLMFQLHYTPNGKDTKDVSTLGVIFAKRTPEHEIRTRPVLNMRFAIPAGDPNYLVESNYTFKEAVKITSFMPHMHLRGKDFLVRAVYGDGKSETLLSVPRYDFNWQTYYVPSDPVNIPAGTRIECVAHFDNSKNNKFNPDPTKVVTWGDQTWEEMMIGWISYYYVNPESTKSVASR